MSRSLLRQLEQIRRANTYDDDISGANTSNVAEPTVSGSLEQDTNVIRTILKQLKGTTNWYDDPGTYFDPTNTSAGNAANKQLSLANISGNTLDSKTVLIGVADTNSSSGYTVASGTAGVLLNVTTRYATPTNRIGLPIFASTAHNGTYADEGGSDNVCRVDVLNMSNGQEFQNGSGYTIYGKLVDGSDHSGSGTGTDVYVKFYANGSPVSLDSNLVTSISFVYPQRKQMSTMSEYEWQRTDFVSSWEGDVELVEDISNLWAFTGASDSDASPKPWDNTAAGYILSSDPSTLKAAIDDLNDGIGNRQYTENNYINDGEVITTSLNYLDMALKDVADSVVGGVGDKYVESVDTLISANTNHSLPYSITYTPNATAGREGSNMDVYVDGQLLAADTGSAGVNADRDYAEVSTGIIKFRFDVQVGRNITYVVRQ